MHSPETAPQASRDAMDGLAFVQALADGRIPLSAMAMVMPYRLLPPASGKIVVEAAPEPRFLNTLGIVHGGWMMTMLDTAMGLAAQSTLKIGEICASHETSVKFLRPLHGNTGALRISGQVLSRGRRVITADGRIEGPDGRLYAIGTTTCMIPEPA
jgi:uncharacterized protein (TIGR00369 family)